LFLVGKLDKLKVWAMVNEADISRVRPQQSVRFTVDAFPDKTFEGKVEQVRLNAQMAQNTVTYTVVIAITGATEGLLPYLTAHVEFQ
jgi:HlyD family secretion protein